MVLIANRYDGAQDCCLASLRFLSVSGALMGYFKIHWTSMGQGPQLTLRSADLFFPTLGARYIPGARSPQGVYVSASPELRQEVALCVG